MNLITGNTISPYVLIWASSKHVPRAVMFQQGFTSAGRLVRYTNALFKVEPSLIEYNVI